MGPELHVIVPMCMPHQIPTYFIGLIQLVFWMTLGGLSFRPSSDGARSVARSANWMVRHGVPTVTFGAGQNEPHTIDEWINLDEYDRACALAVQLATMQ